MSQNMKSLRTSDVHGINNLVGIWLCMNKLNSFEIIDIYQNIFIVVCFIIINVL